MDTKEKIAVMQAHLDGKKIEMRRKADGRASPFGWFDNTLQEPHWDWFNMDYRVAPKKIERWVNFFHNGYVVWQSVHESRAAADNYASDKIGRIACLHVTGVEGEGL